MRLERTRRGVQRQVHRPFESFHIGNAIDAALEFRAPQRGVDRNVLDRLLAYGRREFDHCGGKIVHFDDAALESISRHESTQLWLKASRSRCVYAVVNSDGLVVTTGHRYRRIQRDKSLSSYRTG